MRSRWRCVHLVCFPTHRKGFPDSSVGKESTCNGGDPGSIPGSGRSGREGIGYPLQYSWASLVAQLVKNLPAMWETWVRSLGWEDPMEKGTATPPVFWPGESHGQSMGLQSWTRLNGLNFDFLTHRMTCGRGFPAREASTETCSLSHPVPAS